MGFTAEELIERRKTLGASEIASVAGLSPWESAHDVWCKKLGLVEEVSDVKTRMGNRVEAAVRAEYCEDQKAEVAYFGTLVHPSETWASATPDGAVFGSRRLLEVKCVGWRMAHHWGTEEDAIPAYYRAQAAWQMEVCDADEVHLAAWIGGSDFRIYPIKRDRELGSILLEIGRRFWFENVIARVPPPVDDSEGARRMLNKLYPINRTELRPATDDVSVWIERLKRAREEVARAESRKDLAENKIVEAIGESEGFIGDGWKVTYRADKKGSRRFLFKETTTGGKAA